MRHDILCDALTNLNNAERIGKKTCIVPNSKIVRNVLKVIKQEGYIGDYTEIEKYKIKVTLLGKINKIKALRPRFPVAKNEYKKWENRYLPSKDFGILIISTSKGVMNQKNAEKQKTGGRILAYVY